MRVGWSARATLQTPAWSYDGNRQKTAPTRRHEHTAIVATAHENLRTPLHTNEPLRPFIPSLPSTLPPVPPPCRHPTTHCRHPHPTTHCRHPTTHTCTCPYLLFQYYLDVPRYTVCTRTVHCIVFHSAHLRISGKEWKRTVRLS